MIPFAPITRLIDWLTIDEAARYIRRRASSNLGIAAVEWARGEIGQGERGGNNLGVEQYRGGIPGKGPWCAAFVSTAFEAAASRLGKAVPFKRSHGARKLFRRAVQAGMRVDLQDIQPGDIVLWSRGKSAWQGHVGIVSGVTYNKAGRVTGFHYIAGNEGPYPARVGEFEGKKRRLIGFARV